MPVSTMGGGKKKKEVLGPPAPPRKTVPGSRNPLFTFTPAGKPAPKKKTPVPTVKEIEKAAKDFRFMTPEQKMLASGGFLAAQTNKKAANSFLKAVEADREARRHLADAAKEKAKADAKRDAPIQMAGFSLPRMSSRNLRDIGEISTNFATDFPELLTGLAKFGIASGKAIGKDAYSGRGLAGAASFMNPVILAAHAQQGDLDEYLKNPLPGRHKKESEVNKLARPVVKSIPSSYADLADPSQWKEHPLLQSLNALSVVAPVTRAASIGSLARGARAANFVERTLANGEVIRVPIPRSMALKAGVVESYRPGLLAGEGFEGGIAPRLITMKDAEGRVVKTMENARPTSKSPWGRAGQKAFEDWSTWVGKRNLNSRWAPGSRMGAHAARAAAIERARFEARIQPMVDDVIDGIKSPDASGWNRIKDAFAGIARVDPGKGALVMSALQGPENMSLREAGNASIAEIQARLMENTDFRQRVADVEAAKGTADEISNQMDELRDAIEAGEVSKEDGKAWLAHMKEEMLTFSEEAVKGQEQIDFDLGRDVAPVRSPARQQVLEVLTEQFGAKEAAKKIRYMDAIARSVRGNDPARWYHEVSVRRAKTAEGLDDPLFQRALPKKAPLWKDNPYRQNRLAREAGLEEPYKPPLEFKGEPDTTSAAAQRATANVGKVKPQHRVFTPKQRLKRIISKIDANDVDELSRWYETLWDWFAYIHGEENALKAGNAFLASQAAISPEGGVRVLRQVMDVLRENEYAPGTRVPRVVDKAGKPTEYASIHLTADNIAALLLDEHLGTNPAGVAQKLSDFFDSGFGKLVRGMMENKSEFGGPGVVDRWTMRSDGFIDSDMKRYVEANLKKLGVENAEPLTEENPGGFAYDKVGSDAVYEYSSQKLNTLLQEAIDSKLYGKDDWTIDQIQALDWFATRSTFGPYVDETLEDIGGWGGAMQGSIQTITGVGGDISRETIAQAVRDAGADIPGNDLERYIELDPTTGTASVSFSGSPANAKAIAEAISSLTGKPAYHISPPGVGTATKRAPILTVTGDARQIASAREALRKANEQRVAADDAADAELEDKIATARTDKQKATLQKRLDKQREERLDDPMIFVRDDGIDIVMAKEDAGRLGTAKPVQAELERIHAAVKGNGTIVRDDRILEAHSGRATESRKRGAEADRVPPPARRGGQGALEQRAPARALSADERTELAKLYRERQQLADAPEGTLDADRVVEVRKRIAKLERSQEGQVFGATEGVGTPQRRITLLPKARGGVGKKAGKGRLTFEHEMLHSTVQALDERGQKALSDQYAGGRPVAEWTDAQHEAVASAYEDWIRDTGSVPQPVHDAFTRMEKGGYHNTVILNDEEVNQVTALAAQIADAINHGDHSKMAAARDSLTAMSEESEDIRRWILSYNKTPAQMAKIMENDGARKNIIVDLYRERGLIDPNQEARAYAPHFDATDLLGEGKTGPVSTGMDNVVAGKVSPEGRVMSNKQNKLIRHQIGEVLQDPRAIIWQLRQRMRVMQTIQARDWLWNEHGKPIKKYADLPDNLKARDVIILRNPKATPERIDSITKALQNLTPERMDEIRKMRLGDEGIDIEQILDDLAVDDISHSPSELYYDPRTMKSKPAWLESEENLRYVPRGTAVGRLGKTFNSNPMGKGDALWGTLNGLARISMIYAPGGGARYVARNYLQNMILLATTNPSGFGHMISGINRDLERNYPEAHAIMQSELGAYAGTALPDFNTRARGGAQTVEREITRQSHRAGEALGRWADVPLRSGSYRANAANWGYTSNADIDRLLNPKNANYDDTAHGDRIRQQIRQQTRDDMIDFDALTPDEKNTLARRLFIWPFVRGFAKWPAMYLREYPGRAAAASMIASSQGALEQDDRGWKERYQVDIPEGVPGIGGKKANLSWLSPTGGAEDWAQSIGATATGLSRGQLSLKPLVGGRLTPQLKDLVELLAGDQDAATFGKNALKSFVPGAKDAFQGVDTITGKQDKGDLALQWAGAQVTTSSTGKKKSAKWTGEVDDAVAKIEKKRGAPIPPEAKRRVDKMTAAYEDWAAYEDTRNIRALNEGRAKGLTGQERLEGMTAVAAEHYPTVLAKYEAAAKAHGYASLDDLVQSGEDKDGRAKWVADKLYNEMFGAKSKITKAAKSD